MLHSCINAINKSLIFFSSVKFIHIYFLCSEWTHLMERAKASYIISGQKYFVMYKGNVLTPAAFDELLPIEVRNVSVKGNPISAHQKMVA